MLKFILLGMGFALLIEGLIYFLFAKQVRNMFEAIRSYESEKIRSFSVIIIIIGLCLIYFTFKFYELS
jgi:uncharacterized protein YjeT (DUF2065 family)